LQARVFLHVWDVDSSLPQVFGELEYVFGCFKLMFITMLIMVRAPDLEIDYRLPGASLTSLVAYVLLVYYPTSVISPQVAI
jgi:L-asparagine transporter-like permease